VVVGNVVVVVVVVVDEDVVGLVGRLVENFAIIVSLDSSVYQIGTMQPFSDQAQHKLTKTRVSEVHGRLQRRARLVVSKTVAVGLEWRASDPEHGIAAVVGAFGAAHCLQVPLAVFEKPLVPGPECNTCRVVECGSSDLPAKGVVLAVLHDACARFQRAALCTVHAAGEEHPLKNMLQLWTGRG